MDRKAKAEMYAKLVASDTTAIAEAKKLAKGNSWYLSQSDWLVFLASCREAWILENLPNTSRELGKAFGNGLIDAVQERSTQIGEGALKILEVLKTLSKSAELPAPAAPAAPAATEEKKEKKEKV